MKTKELMREMRRDTMNDFAAIVARTCDERTIASLLSAFVSLEADEAISNYELDLGEQFFDALVELCPDVKEVGGCRYDGVKE